MSGTRTIFFANIIWAELSLVFWTFLSGTFFPGGGGGARARTDIDLSLSMIILAFFQIKGGAFIEVWPVEIWRRGVY